ncbi:MAG: DUF4440 domain-containing protein [Alphaproteobacteria bacterium]|nr:DUF4440 domain-containing protein [Alphaproteobacteria bacterium]MBV9371846.1 DUF4440 domain-containing protein [Alphaproteobacteria bacterium]MBV9901293.1 DUF4440 domain-containing protein [Alphaproteobacteria bacterium]
MGTTIRALVAAAVAVAATAPPAAAGGRDDAAVNRLYEEIAAGVAANAGKAVAAAFAEDAVVLDPRPGPPAAGPTFRSSILAMAARLKADGVKVSSAYRIERRIASGDLVIDTGYRRQTFASPAADGPQPGVQYHKFLVVAQRRAGEGWKIVRDASLPASKDSWDAAVRTPGLKYDE